MSTVVSPRKSSDELNKADGVLFHCESEEVTEAAPPLGNERARDTPDLGFGRLMAATDGGG